jgi:mono/diheme cytochrome c family protein
MRTQFLFLILFLAGALTLAACSGGDKAAVGDAARGRAVFVEKGCVICHAVNGTGGKAAPALDAVPGASHDPLDFASRMWRGAPAMVEFQSVELGYVIEVSGPEIADLAAFAGSQMEQAKFNIDAVPEPMRASLLDERFWEAEDWSEFMARGQQGAGDPAPPVDEAPAQPAPQ